MTFISYAQNYEDVMLWRALSSVPAGFWIDVGAADPTEFSVTRAFYDRGWCGVNIEPEPDYAAALRAERPRDINLQVAIAATTGRATIYRIPGTGLSTFDAAIASGHAAAGFPAAQPMEVETTTLAAVCAAHAPRDIHFLKIDVEGAEREVLLGADFTAYRPWIILVEATFPGSPVPRIETFADVLVAADYRQCWFDGLNAFFLAMEHEARLAPCFRMPPNVFDAFVHANQVAAVARAEAAEARVGELDHAWHEGQAAMSAAAALHEARVLELQADIDRRLVETQRLDAETQRLETEKHGLETEKHGLETEKHGLETEKHGLETEIQRLESEIPRLESETHRLEAETRRLEAELDTIHRSASWRLTASLRATARLLKRP